MFRVLAVLMLAACTRVPPETPGEVAASDESQAPDSDAGEGADAPSSPSEDGESPPEGRPPGAQSLPAVRVTNVGLHVGGGSNDAASKAPFLRSIERNFPEFLRCYRLIGEPGTGGTFGVDLHVPKTGGRGRVEQPRTGLLGDDFRACMLSAFERVEFEPSSKPVVISYSLRFSLEE